jgi:hypothetical protein
MALGVVAAEPMGLVDIMAAVEPVVISLVDPVLQVFSLGITLRQHKRIRWHLPSFILHAVM